MRYAVSPETKATAILIRIIFYADQQLPDHHQANRDGARRARRHFCPQRRRDGQATAPCRRRAQTRHGRGAARAQIPQDSFRRELDRSVQRRAQTPSCAASNSVVRGTVHQSCFAKGNSILRAPVTSTQRISDVTLRGWPRSANGCWMRSIKNKTSFWPGAYCRTTITCLLKRLI